MAFDSILYILLSDSNKNIVITFGHEMSHLVSFELKEREAHSFKMRVYIILLLRSANQSHEEECAIDQQAKTASQGPAECLITCALAHIGATFKGGWRFLFASL